MKRLSEHDRAVLDVIFDPLQLMGSTISSASNGEDNNSANCSSGPESVELSSDVVAIVGRAIEASENGRFEEALELFEEAIRKAPQSPAVLNDRAQTLRLLGRDADKINKISVLITDCGSPHALNLVSKLSVDALKDLNSAVDLSNGRGKAGIQALCQRGVLHRCAGRMDKAREDFDLAARGGSSFARTQLVALNPYAAMCNAMLRDLSAKSSEH